MVARARNHSESGIRDRLRGFRRRAHRKPRLRQRLAPSRQHRFQLTEPHVTFAQAGTNVAKHRRSVGPTRSDVTRQRQRRRPDALHQTILVIDRCMGLDVTATSC
jgi:hypothetical protein